MEANTVPTKKKLRLSVVITISVVSVLAIAGGIGTGIYLSNALKAPTNQAQENKDVSGLYDDTSALLKNYQDIQDAGGDFVTAYGQKPYLAIEAAYLLFQNHAHTFAQGIGTGTANVLGIAITQDIRSTQIRDENEYFEESLSQSNFVNIADRMYQKNDVIRYVGKTVSGSVDKVDSLDEGTRYSFDDYRALMGRLLSDPSSYIVSSKTVYLSDLTPSGTPTSFKKTSDGYQVELELKCYNKDTAGNVVNWAITNYVKQMKSISDLASYPKFSYCHLSFSLDSSLNLLSSVAHEYYSATTSSGASSNVEGLLRTVYESDGAYTIPTGKEPVVYRSEQ